MECFWTWCCDILRNPTWFYLLTTVAKLVLVFAVILAFVVLSVWIERRVAGWIQDRPGPNRAGLPLFLLRPFGSKKAQPLASLLHFLGCPPDGRIARLCRWLRLDREIPTFGLIQPCLDGGKLFLKQEITPSYVRKFYFILAPMLVLGPPLVAAAVVPFSSGVSTPFGDISLCVANLNIGPLWVFAVSGLSVYGLTLAGWSSNSKYPFLGGLRATAHPAAHGVWNPQFAGHSEHTGDRWLDTAAALGRRAQPSTLGALDTHGSQFSHVCHVHLCGSQPYTL